jgi:hypothetical protein
MVEAGEAAMAEEYCDLFGFSPSILNLNPEEMAAEEVERHQKFLQNPFPPSNLMMIDSRSVADD